MFIPLVDPPADADHDQAMWFCVRGTEVLMLEEGGLPIELEAAAECTVFLGTLLGRPVWAAGLRFAARRSFARSLA